MAIRFKYDATGVVLPENKSQQRLGQSLILQQQKYANDQRLGMQDRAYDQQRMANQQQFILDRDAKEREIAGQKALADLNANQKFGAKKNAEALALEQQKQQQEAEKAAKDNIERLRAQERTDDFAAIKNGNFRGKAAADLAASHDLETQINIDAASGMLDAAMAAEAHAKNRAARAKIKEGRIGAPSEEDLLNANVKWVDPTGTYHKPDLEKYPNGKPAGWKIYDGNTKHTQQDPKQLPDTAIDFYNADTEAGGNLFDKKLAETMSDMQKKIDVGDMKLEEGADLRTLAWKKMQDDYDFRRSALRRDQAQAAGQAMPPQVGQPAVPPVVPPQAVQPVEGMPNLEPAYNADGTTALPGQSAMPLPQEPSLEEAMNAQNGMAQPGQTTRKDVALLPGHPDYVAPPPMQDGGKVNEPGTWAAMAEADQKKPSITLEASPAATSKATAIPTPDFDTLVASSEDSTDKAVFGKLKGIYETQPIEVQNAIGILVNPKTPKRNKAEAVLFLKMAGIDLDKIIGPAPGTADQKLNEYQKNSRTTMR